MSRSNLEERERWFMLYRTMKIHLLPAEEQEKQMRHYCDCRRYLNNKIVQRNNAKPEPDPDPNGWGCIHHCTHLSQEALSRDKVFQDKFSDVPKGILKDCIEDVCYPFRVLGFLEFRMTPVRQYGDLTYYIPNKRAKLLVSDGSTNITGVTGTMGCVIPEDIVYPPNETFRNPKVMFDGEYWFLTYDIVYYTAIDLKNETVIEQFHIDKKEYDFDVSSNQRTKQSGSKELYTTGMTNGNLVCTVFEVEPSVREINFAILVPCIDRKACTIKARDRISKAKAALEKYGVVNSCYYGICFDNAFDLPGIEITPELEALLKELELAKRRLNNIIDDYYYGVCAEIINAGYIRVDFVTENFTHNSCFQGYDFSKFVKMLRRECDFHGIKVTIQGEYELYR